MLTRTRTRTILRQAGRARYSSSSSGERPLPPPPPRGSFFSASTVYPFILLSAITSLALNLSHQRTARAQETAHLSAQVTVLEALLDHVRSRAMTTDDDGDDERIERELELVGLGRGRGKRALGEGDREGKRATSWSEVLFGNRATEYQPDQDDTDWERVFQEAEAADLAKSSTRSTSARSENTLPTPVLVAPPPPSPPTPSPTPTDDAAPRPPQPKKAAIYL
ncbi:hypothetical protein JCM11491_001487 [Sporobolomyces phaffii]